MQFVLFCLQSLLTKKYPIFFFSIKISQIICVIDSNRNKQHAINLERKILKEMKICELYNVKFNF